MIPNACAAALAEAIEWGEKARSRKEELDRVRADLSSRSQQLEQMQAATSSQSSSRLEQQLADTEHQFNELLTGVSPGSLRSEIDGTNTLLH